MKDLIYHKEYRSSYLIILFIWRPLVIPIGFIVVMEKGFIELGISAYFVIAIRFRFWKT
jgi:hypothetical protein